jgi:hypothetical protein
VLALWEANPAPLPCLVLEPLVLQVPPELLELVLEVELMVLNLQAQVELMPNSNNNNLTPSPVWEAWVEWEEWEESTLP